MSIYRIDPRANDQADMCAALMESLGKRLYERIWKYDNEGKVNPPQPLTNAALERQITTLRMELLELQKIIRA